MPSGLQVFTSQGTVIFDTNDNFTRVLGTQQCTSGQAGSLTNANLASGRWFAAVVDPPTGSWPITYPTFSYNATTKTISWTAPSYAARFIYGVY